MRLWEMRMAWEVRRHSFLWVLPVAYLAVLWLNPDGVRFAREWYMFFADYVMHLRECV